MRFGSSYAGLGVVSKIVAFCQSELGGAGEQLKTPGLAMAEPGYSCPVIRLTFSMINDHHLP